MKKLTLLCFPVLLFAAVAFAHGDEDHLMGTVTQVTDTSITIQTKNKKTVEVGLVPGTKYLKGDATASRKDVQVGHRVVIHSKKEGGKLVATMVRIGALGARVPKP